MSGGNATAGGIEYQGQVGALFASHILAKKSISDIGPGIPISIQMEAISPVDDIVVRTDIGGSWFVNVKTEVSVSTSNQSQLSSVVDQFVRQWIEGVFSPKNSRKLDPALDRLVLILKPNRSRNLVSGLNPVLKRFRDATSDTKYLVKASTISEANAFDALSSLLHDSFDKHIGEQPSSEEFAAFVSCISILEFEFAGSSRAAIETLLSSVVKPSDASNALDTLTLACIALSRARSSGNQETFRKILGEKQIALNARDSFRRDIEKLCATSSASLNDLERYARIQVKADSSEIHLARDCYQSINTALNAKTSFLVVGDPGAGKSGALYNAATEQIKADKTVLMVQVDQLNSNNLEGLKSELSLEHPLLDILQEWIPINGGILLIDALDASRGTGAEPAVRSLISQVQIRAPHWTIVASIRKFDLRYGKEYQRLFSGKAIDSKFEDDEFRDVRHINIPQLNSDEILAIRSQWPMLNMIANSSGKEFQSLLSSPFNLYLLGRILNKSSQTNSALTQLDLLNQFWQLRVEQSEFVASVQATIALENILRKMLQTRRLTINFREIPQDSLESVKRHLQNGVLYQPLNTQLLSFSHHVLFDFALAKLVFLQNQSDSFDDDISEATNDMLLVAPAIILALRIVWNSDESRINYWKLSLRLAGDKKIGSFVRALPARVAAEAIQTTADVSYLIRSLTDPNFKSSASTLVQHLLNVLLADVIPNVPRFDSDNDPWCEIVSSVAEVSIETLEWPIFVVIREWIGKKLTKNQKSSIGKAGRRLLTHQFTNGVQYREGSVAAAIKVIVRTFADAPKESSQLIEELLKPSRVQDKGHRELFWLAQEFTHLTIANANLAADFLVSAFTSPLPSRDEETVLGDSRILSLTSNKKQDFESILYSLEKGLSKFLVSTPVVAGNAVRRLLSESIRSERNSDNSAKVGIAEFQDSTIRFWQDLSCIWWGVEKEPYEHKAKIIETICTVLSETTDLNFTTYLEALLADDIPAVILAVCLRAASTRSDPGKAVDLLYWKDVFTMMDTSYDAAQLLKKHYKFLPLTSKIELQAVIASIEDDYRKLILISCIADGEEISNKSLLALQAANQNEPKPSLEPTFALKTGWSSIEQDNWWLKEKGVDTETSDNKTILSAVETLKLTNLPSDNDEALHELADYWAVVDKTLNYISRIPELHPALQNTLFDAIADVVLAICDRSNNIQQVSKFVGLREVIDKCLNPELIPKAIVDAKREKEFSESQGWGKPAPRIEAAAALMAYVRAAGVATEEDKTQILALAKDAAVEVRHSILSRANVVCIADPKLSKDLAYIALTEEQNEGVLSFFLISFNSYLGQAVDWAPGLLISLSDRLGQTNDSHRHDSKSGVVGLIINLWLTWKVPEANSKIHSWIAEPLVYRNQVTEIISRLRALVSISEEEDNNTNKEFLRNTGKDYFYIIVTNLAAEHQKLLSEANTGKDVKIDLTHTIEMLHAAANQLYFGSGAYDLSKSQNYITELKHEAEKRQFLHNYLPSLRILAQTPYPAVTHPVLELLEALMGYSPEEMLELFFLAIQVGGKEGGYQFESLGANLVVNIARKFLADYPGLIARHPDYRKSLVEALNLFAEIGWPEARKLVYQLPEMLR